MPCGICSAPEIIHRAFSEFLKILKVIYIDVILIWGETQQDHDLRLKALFDSAREYNI